MRNAIWILGEGAAIATGWLLCRLGRHVPLHLGAFDTDYVHGQITLYYCSRCDAVFA